MITPFFILPFVFAAGALGAPLGVLSQSQPLLFDPEQILALADALSEDFTRAPVVPFSVVSTSTPTLMISAIPGTSPFPFVLTLPSPARPTSSAIVVPTASVSSPVSSSAAGLSAPFMVSWSTSTSSQDALSTSSLKIVVPTPAAAATARPTTAELSSYPRSVGPTGQPAAVEKVLTTSYATSSTSPAPPLVPYATSTATATVPSPAGGISKTWQLVGVSMIVLTVVGALLLVGAFFDTLTALIVDVCCSCCRAGPSTEELDGPPLWEKGAVPPRPPPMPRVSQLVRSAPPPAPELAAPPASALARERSERSARAGRPRRPWDDGSPELAAGWADSETGFRAPARSPPRSEPASTQCASPRPLPTPPRPAAARASLNPFVDPSGVPWTVFPQWDTASQA